MADELGVDIADVACIRATPPPPGHIETPAPTNPGGHKGMGEGGAIASPPAVINAVADALAPLGVTIRNQPLSPSEIVSLIASNQELMR